MTLALIVLAAALAFAERLIGDKGATRQRIVSRTGMSTPAMGDSRVSSRLRRRYRKRSYVGCSVQSCFRFAPRAFGRSS